MSASLSVGRWRQRKPFEPGGRLTPGELGAPRGTPGAADRARIKTPAAARGPGSRTCPARRLRGACASAVGPRAGDPGAPHRPTAPRSCTRPGLGPAQKALRTLILIIPFFFVWRLLLRARLPQLSRSFPVLFPGCSVAGAAGRTQPLGPRSRDLGPAGWSRGRLGIWVLAAPQRHLLALGGDSFEIGVFQVALAPEALDPGCASDPWDLSLSTDT